MNDKEWFAVRVRPLTEGRVVTGLVERGFEAFAPSRRVRRSWSDRTVVVQEALFPGYFFCRLQITRDRLRLLQSPGVISLVGIGNSPVPIEESEIAAVRSIVESGAALSPWPYVRVGQRVRIARGPLSGVDGIVLRCEAGSRVIVSVSLLQRSIAADIQNDWLS